MYKVLIVFIFGFILKSYFYETSLIGESTTVSVPIKNIQVFQKYYSDKMRYSFDINGISAQIPYATNMIISQDHNEVTRLILAIHSSSYNPDTYLDNSLELFKNNTKNQDKTLIISPALFRKDKTKLSNIVTWGVSPFWGSSRALFHGKKIELSSYEVLDNILTHIITSKHFPNLTDIIILGHSAGGQLVNRYAASNSIENTIAMDHQISIRYLVMAPSSYVYFDRKRIKKSSKTEFAFPFVAYKKYNYWGYGLEHLYSYHKRHHISAYSIQFNYKYRKVLYLVGENDITNNALDQSKAAMLEGKNRLERLQIYYKYLQTYYGEEISEYQAMAIIKNTGHSGRVLMNSDEGKSFILND